jgi:hypothetical protein
MDADRRETKGFSTSFTVDRPPREVFDAINDVRGWWTGEITGQTDALGAEFTYRHRELHRSTQKIVELVPGQRIVWRGTAASLSFVQDPAEWEGTEIVFELASEGGRTEVRFSHLGLVPRLQCYRDCSSGWRFYLEDSLRNLIATGRGDPAAREAEARR